MNRHETILALRKYESGAELSPADLELMARAVAVNDFLDNRCMFAEPHAKLLEGIAQVLTRIPQAALDELVARQVYIILPQLRENYTFALGFAAQSSAWFVVLDAALPKESLEVIAGTVSHELAHVFLGHNALLLGHRSGTPEEEEDADSLARSWGFGKEIYLVNKSWPRYGIDYAHQPQHAPVDLDQPAVGL